MTQHQIKTERSEFPSDISDQDILILNQIKDYTMTSMERQLALIHSIRHLVRSGIPGCFVECGVWRGGSAMAAALTLIQEKDTSRHLYLFDTFEGMTEPTDLDRTTDGVLAKTHLTSMERGTEWWCYSSLDEVKANLVQTGFPGEQIHFIKGPVEQTIPTHSPTEPIALLRLDTDWYESTSHELIHLFPLLHEGGILIIDDYGHWEGARKATDEYLASLPRKHYLHRIDYTGRLVVKDNLIMNDSPTYEQNGMQVSAQNVRASVTQSHLNSELDSVPETSNPETGNYVVYPAEGSLYFPEGDYISPGLEQIRPDRCFPNMLIGDRFACSWPFLRREIPHNWYVDQRYPHVGFINRDEAHILYNSARLFQGKRGLEVGCWMGWSACHIALAGVELDVIDPMLEKPEFMNSVSDSLRRADVLSSVRLIPGTSPAKVEELAHVEHRRWSFLFIDGDHESPGPLNDVRACEPFAEADAMILFHDLVSPGVTEGLDYLRRKGWQVMVYHTMQIMGVAWRGKVQPIIHQPDSSLCWSVPAHIHSFPSDLNSSQFDPTVPDTSQRLESLTERLQGELDWLRLQLKTSQESGWRLEGEKGWFETEYHKTAEKLYSSEAEVTSITAQLEARQTQLHAVKEQLEQANAQQTKLAAKLKQSTSLLAYQQKRLLQFESDYLPRHQFEQTVQTFKARLEEVQENLAQLKEKLAKKHERIQFQRSKLEQQTLELSDAKARIAAMETSKFWKLRKIWFMGRRLFGLSGDE